MTAWDDNDAYGNPLPKPTPRQLAKEISLYRYIGAQLEREARGES